MIYKIEFEGGDTEWCTANDVLHLLKSYDSEVTDIIIQDIDSITEISDEEAKKTMVRNSEFDEDNPSEMPEFISLYDLGGDVNDFTVIASNQDY